MNLKPIILILLGLALIIGSLIVGLNLERDDSQQITGDCYDHYGNVINGLTCQIDDHSSLGWILFLLALSGLLLIFWGVLEYVVEVI